MIRLAPGNSNQENDPSQQREGFRDFNPGNYENGNLITYYQGGQWKLGKVSLEATPADDIKVEDGYIKMSIKEVEEGITKKPGRVILTKTPRLIKLPDTYGPGIPYVLDKVTYFYGDLHSGPSGEVLVDLKALDKKNKDLLGVNIDLLNNVRTIESQEIDLVKKIQELANEARRVSGGKTQEIMDNLIKLRKTIAGMPVHLGFISDWSEMAHHKVESINEKIQAQMQEVQESLKAFEENIKQAGESSAQEKNQAEKSKLARKILRVADHILAENDNAMKKNPELAKWQEYEKNLEKYNKDKEEFEKNNKPKKGDKDKDKDKGDDKKPEFTQKPPVKPSGEKPKLPSEDPGAREKIMAELYDKLDGLNDKLLVAYRGDLKNEVDSLRKKHCQENNLSGLEDYPKDGDTYKQVSTEKFIEVLERWKGLAPESTPDQAPAVADPNSAQEQPSSPEVKDYASQQIEDLNQLQINLLEKAKKINDFHKRGKFGLQLMDIDDKEIKSLNKKSNNFENHVLEVYKHLDNIDLEIEAELHTQEEFSQVRPIEHHEKRQETLDLSGLDIMEVMRENKDRSKKMQDFMVGLYNSELSGKEPDETNIQAFKELFNTPANQEILGKLKKRGVRSWEHFQSLIDKHAQKMVGVLRKMIQDQLARQINMKSSVIGKLWAQKWRLGIQVGVTILAAGSMAIGFKALLSTAAIGVVLGAAASKLGLGVVTAGAFGSIGAMATGTGKLVHSVFDKLGFKDAREKKIEKYERELKVKVIEELQGKWLDANELENTTAMFSAIMTEGLNSGIEEENQKIGLTQERIKDVSAGLSAQEKQELDKEFASLGRSEREIYLQAIDKLRAQENTEPTFKQKLDLIVAIGRLKAIDPSHPEQMAEKEPGMLEEIYKSTVGKMAIGFVVGAMTTNEYTRFALGAGGGGIASMVAVDRLESSLNEKKSEKLFQKKLDRFRNIIKVFDNPNFTTDKQDLAGLRTVYAEFKLLLEGKTSGKIENENLVKYIQDYDIVKAEIRDCLNKVQRIILSAGLEEIKDLGDLVVAQAEEKVGWLSKFKKKAGWGAVKVGAGIVGGFVAGMVAAGMGERYHRHLTINKHSILNSTGASGVQEAKPAVNLDAVVDATPKPSANELLQTKNSPFFAKMGVAPTEVNGKLHVEFELGKNNVPSTRSKFFRLLALNDMKEDMMRDQLIKPAEQAKVLNVSANLRALAAGHDIPGANIKASEVKDIISFDGKKIMVKDWQALFEADNNVMDRLQEHASKKFDGPNGEWAAAAAKSGKANALRYVDLVNWKKDLNAIGYDENQMSDIHVEKGHFPKPAPTEVDAGKAYFDKNFDPYTASNDPADFTLNPFDIHPKTGAESVVIQGPVPDLKNVVPNISNNTTSGSSGTSTGGGGRIHGSAGGGAPVIEQAGHEMLLGHNPADVKKFNTWADLASNNSDQARRIQLIRSHPSVSSDEFSKFRDMWIRNHPGDINKPNLREQFIRDLVKFGKAEIMKGPEPIEKTLNNMIKGDGFASQPEELKPSPASVGAKSGSTTTPVSTANIAVQAKPAVVDTTSSAPELPSVPNSINWDEHFKVGKAVGNIRPVKFVWGTPSLPSHSEVDISTNIGIKLSTDIGSNKALFPVNFTNLIGDGKQTPGRFDVVDGKAVIIIPNSEYGRVQGAMQELELQIKNGLPVFPDEAK
ncbi:MAG: hypothetical protein ABIH87_03570 [bacterium]